MIVLDGSMGEGGGQILRSSLALSLLSGRAFRIENIRAGREVAGLRPQHLASVQAAASIGQAEVRGAEVGSQQLEFRPGRVRPGDYHFRIGTAGSTSLVLQTISLPLALAAASSSGSSSERRASSVTIEGGTHVPSSPCFDFLNVTWRDWLWHLGISVELHMHQAGFYPQGSGRIEAHIQPCFEVRTQRLTERGPLERISGTSAVANLPQSIADRQKRRALQRLIREGYPTEIDTITWPSIGKGTMLALVAHYPHGRVLVDGLGAIGKPAEEVADEAVDQLFAYLAATPAVADPHSADQIVLPLAFAPGRSELTTTVVTSHLETNLEVLRRFVDRRFVCEGERGQPGRVVIE